MAKKGKDEAPNPNGVTNRDIIQRLSFLYQASVYLSAIPNQVQPVASTSSSDQRVKKPARRKDGRKKLKSMHKVTAGDLAKTYVSTMKAVGQKTTVKIDPAVKRTLCKGCNMTLIPGSTASVRVKKSTSHGQCMVYTCNGCKTPRRIPAPPTLDPDTPQTLDSTSMEVDTTGSSNLDATPTEGTTRDLTVEGKTFTRGTKPRLPPLFAREAGHVVFCGNERLPDPEPGRGNGIYIS